MTLPSVRGTGFQSAADDIQRLLDTHRLTRDELEARLTPDDVLLLESKISATTWIPVDTYRRVVELLVSIEAEGDPEGYLFQRGWRAAERLHKAGLYSQFDATMEKWGTRVGRLIVTLSSELWNFTEWTFELEPGLPLRGFRLIVRGAGELPECARLTSHGFIEYLTRSAVGLTLRVTSERLPGGVVIFTATTG
jgi:hypothetical protein